MHVDDLFGCCRKRDVEEELTKGETVITGLLGDGTVNREKNKHGPVVDIIGWEFNILTQKVSVARKNLMKAMCCLFQTDLDGFTTVKELQRASSYCEQYSAICGIFRPFLSCMYRIIQDSWGLHKPIKYSEKAKAEIRMWRA